MSWYLLGLDSLYNYVTGNSAAACNAFDTLCQQTGGMKTYLDCIPDLVEPVAVPVLNAAVENYSPLRAILAGAAVVGAGAALVYGYCRYRNNHSDSSVYIKQEIKQEGVSRYNGSYGTARNPIIIGHNDSYVAPKVDRRCRPGSDRNPIVID
ncbi:MAG: hypothetical protein HYX61_00485 [Gammaproteobacteria bacterium]|jgi:hypothetical protein|nr:hypothetical protein [Gammaproteobacteria bacterium]